MVAINSLTVRSLYFERGTDKDTYLALNKLDERAERDTFLLLSVSPWDSLSFLFFQNMHI